MKNVQCLLSLVAVSSIASTVLAAPIAWSPAFEVVSDADINLAGRSVVYAANGGSNQPLTGPLPVTVGDRIVNFQGVSILTGAGSTFGQTTYGDVIDHLAGQNFPVSYSVVSDRGGNSNLIPFASFDPGAGLRTVYGVTTGNTGLDALLNSQIWTDGRKVSTDAAASHFKISINDLIPGQAYQVQIIAGADARPSSTQNSANTYLVSDGEAGSVAVPGLAAYADLNNDGTRHVTSILGDFVAGGTSQNVDITIGFGRNPGISALILTTVPEPSTIAVVGVLLPLLARRRR